MRKVVVFMFSIVLFGSCSSEKTLSEQIKYDWDINYNSSQDNGNERPYNFYKNLKNSSVQNQTEHQISLPTVKNYQDLLASNDKVNSSVLTNNYSYKKLTKIIQKERIYKSFNEKPQFFEAKKISANKSKIKDKKNKILWIIVSVVFIAATIFMSLLSLLFFSFGFPIDAVIGLSISLILGYLSFRAVKKTTESNSKDDNKDSNR